VIHGDIKPQNVIVFKLDDGSFIPKVADFGYSSPYSDHELLINLPESYPWYAPELHEYPNFTPSQASTADIFSYGMLCLWLIFEKYLSGHESLPEASTAMVLKYTDEDGNASLKNLADLRSNISPLELSDYLIGANKELDTQARLPLRRFFHGTLALDPNERSTDLSQVISHLDVGNETVRDEVDATKYNPPLAEDFHVRLPSPACNYRK
jgi:serine/threonine protein kinase